MQTATLQGMHAKSVRSLSKALEEVREELEFCLSDRDKYAQEVHLLKVWIRMWQLVTAVM